MRPKIGIVPLIDTARESWWMLPGYMDGIRKAGGLPLMFPLTTSEDETIELASDMDGILITGGQDASPALYGAEPSPACGETFPALDTMTAHLLRFAIASDLPILGICRGIQIVNVLLGGTLYQDIAAEYPTAVEHHMTPPYDRMVHRVSFPARTPLRALLGADEIAVNSYHHQAVKDVSDELRVMATSEDGIVEGLYRPSSRFLWAVQWHPECAYKKDENSRKIFAAFVHACA